MANLERLNTAVQKLKDQLHTQITLAKAAQLHRKNVRMQLELEDQFDQSFRDVEQRIHALQIERGVTDTQAQYHLTTNSKLPEIEAIFDSFWKEQVSYPTLVAAINSLNEPEKIALLQRILKEPKDIKP